MKEKIFYTAKELREIGIPKETIDIAAHCKYTDEYMFKTKGGGKFIYNLDKLIDYLPLIAHEKLF